MLDEDERMCSNCRYSQEMGVELRRNADHCGAHGCPASATLQRTLANALLPPGEETDVYAQEADGDASPDSDQ